AEALQVSERLGLPRYETLQPHYNLYARSKFEGPLADLCAREKIGVIPYFALASGFLTGKYRSEADLSGRARAGFVKKMLDARGYRILAALDEVADIHSAAPAQIALAWLRARGVAAPIASATTREQLADLTAYVEVNLSDAEVARLDAASEESSD
ncbi:MAG TPA: aldo/keto reductase, partial [Gammaproteobacteria bacterium]|nr:aldo/keto reductase [Gammaproteobacteria bacterium]